VFRIDIRGWLPCFLHNSRNFSCTRWTVYRVSGSERLHRWALSPLVLRRRRLNRVHTVFFDSVNNKKFWKELICLLSLHYLNENCPSGIRNFIIFLYFIHLRRKLNCLKRYDISQNYRILHRVVQRLSQHNVKVSHHRHI
jgi:hypothetical protein